MEDWIHGSFNVCIRVEIEGNPGRQVMIRFPLPYRIGENCRQGMRMRRSVVKLGPMSGLKRTVRLSLFHIFMASGYLTAKLYVLYWPFSMMKLVAYSPIFLIFTASRFLLEAFSVCADGFDGYSVTQSHPCTLKTVSKIRLASTHLTL